ncbi:MAG TPA: hypothetical protein VFP84_14515 [Kofleriaceae bacterium]|nr:hypothetical protein [Kofleriaceae bacterium]
MQVPRREVVGALIGVLFAAGPAWAGPLAALAPGAVDDARKAIAIGPGGEVYEPDGKGAWSHRAPITTAAPLTAAGRAGDAVVALGDGVVYRLADNGWSALRLVQHGKAVLGAGPRALAAVGRQVFALDTLTGGEPTKLVAAPGPVVALAAGGKAAVIVTDAAAFRLALVGKPGKLAALPAAPRKLRLVSDRWAIVERGALELPSGKLTRWPAGLAIGVAAVTGDDALVAVATSRAGLELLTVRGGAIARAPIDGVAASATAVGVVVDRAGRAAVALADGRIAVRDKAGWTIAAVSDAVLDAHPGPPPAISGT